MPRYDNPAGRLHALLTAYDETGGVPIAAAWAAALDVPQEDLALHLGRVAELLPQIERAAFEEDAEAYEDMPEELRALGACIFPTTVPFSNPVRDNRPNAVAMKSLVKLSSALSKRAPDGEIPDAEELDGLREMLRDLSDEIENADSIAPDVKRLLLDRIAQMLRALQQIKISGPGEVRKAAEALAGAVAFSATKQDAKPTTNVLLKAVNVAARVAASVTIFHNTGVVADFSNVLTMVKALGLLPASEDDQESEDS